MATIFILAAIFCHYIVRLKSNENRIIGLDGYLFLNIDRNKFSFDRIEEHIQDVSLVLDEVLAGFYRWDQLPLTEHFKNKFKHNRRNIIWNICDFKSLSHYIAEKNDEKIIEIYGERYDNILTDKILPPIATIYEFKYKVVDGKLDDVELIEKSNINATTGKRFFVKDDTEKFEP